MRAGDAVLLIEHGTVEELDDLPELLKNKALSANGREEVVVAPIGFLADHVEILYDLDIEARSWAEELGITLRRAPSLNVSDGLVDALATVANGVPASPGGE